MEATAEVRPYRTRTPSALKQSTSPSIFALCAVGIAKGRVTRGSFLRSAVQVMVIGSVSAGVGFAIGHLVTTLSG
jgi:VIT1/CCC1 family predicted Fe2+/Mn2+ transporter